jgi:hypothetical protein
MTSFWCLYLLNNNNHNKTTTKNYHLSWSLSSKQQKRQQQIDRYLYLLNNNNNKNMTRQQQQKDQLPVSLSSCLSSLSSSVMFPANLSNSCMSNAFKLSSSSTSSAFLLIETFINIFEIIVVKFRVNAF